MTANFGPMPVNVQNALRQLNTAGSKEIFDVAKINVMKEIEDSLNDASVDSKQRLGLEYMDQFIEMSDYLDPPQTENGAPVDAVLSSLFSLVGLCVFVIEEFRKLVVDAGLTAMENATLDRVFAMAQERQTMGVAYDQSVDAAHAGQRAAMIQGFTTMAEGLVSGVISGISSKYAFDGAASSRKAAKGREDLITMKDELSSRQKTRDVAQDDLDNARKELSADPTSQKKLNAVKEAEEELEKANVAVKTRERDVEIQSGKCDWEEREANVLNALSTALSSFSRLTQMIVGAGTLGASDHTVKEKIAEAIAQFMKSLEGISSALKQSGDEAYRNAMDLINNVIEFYKEAIPLVSKGPSGY